MPATIIQGSTIQGASIGPRLVTSGLVLHLDAGNSASYSGSGTTWTDLSGSGNNGTLTNGPTFNSSNGGSIVFDGTNDYVSLGTFNGLGSISRTFDVWFVINSLSASGTKRVISFVTDETYNDTPAVNIGYDTSGVIGMGGSPYDGYHTNISITVGAWENWIVTIVANSSINFYRNGVYVATKSNTGTVGANPIGYIGRYNTSYGQYGNVQVSNLKVYNRALSAGEIRQNFLYYRDRFNV